MDKQLDYGGSKDPLYVPSSIIHYPFSAIRFLFGGSKDPRYVPSSIIRFPSSVVQS